jgi:hypothetical protein
MESTMTVECYRLVVFGIACAAECGAFMTRASSQTYVLQPAISVATAGTIITLRSDRDMAMREHPVSTSRCRH